MIILQQIFRPPEAGIHGSGKLNITGSLAFRETAVEMAESLKESAAYHS